MIEPPNTEHKPTNSTICMSLEVQIEGLQMLFKHKSKGVKKKTQEKKEEDCNI
jgi:hypothetical protein